MKKTNEELRKIWKQEEDIAHIKGWDFSYLNGRFESDDDIPWDYEKIIKQYLKDDMKLLDYDTGGGEFLLTLNHPYENTAATEGYPPNVELCSKTLLPLGIDFKKCDDCSRIPFDDEAFDIFINRHGDFDPREIYRLLKPGGIFITQQVGDQNDADLVRMVLPQIKSAFHDHNLEAGKKRFLDAGFEILSSDEIFGSIRFYDVGAFVWFARIIEWEFLDFSVDKCFDRLLKLQEVIDKDGIIKGTTHRYYIVVKKK
ncbi:MAG: methyltransferase domain-containing protein [Lachnospiraceae bacterium]|nr:methyltransferase domain-containing protein [Lachnospiraceae bacterium]